MGETAVGNAILQEGTDTANSVGSAAAMNEEERRRLQREEFVAAARREQARQGQRDQELTVKRGAVSPLGGQAKRSGDGR
jgi:hypothetical protein